MAVQTNNAQQVPPSAKELNGHPQIPQGGLFGLPGITYWSEQLENNDQTTLVLSSSTQTVFQFPANLTNTDILYREIIDVSIANTNAIGTGTIFTSAYFPYNYLGPMSLSMQNQFNTFDVPSGIDAKIFELIRPQYNTIANDVWEQNPNVSTYNAEANLSTASNYTFTSNPIKFTIDLPLGIQFDRYFDLDPDGQLRGNMGPARAFVTPQLMSGSNRIVTPRMLFNPILASNTDNGPFVVNSLGTLTAGGTVTLGWQRKIVYQPKSATDTPVLWGWQYSREAKQYGLGGRSSADIVLPTTGQLLMIYYRFYDPSAASGGAPIASSVIKNLWLQYGSGLYKFQDTPLRAQRRFQRQHNNVIMPVGVQVHDMVIDEQGLTTNANALNTLDTSSCKIHLDFTGSLSATAYVVIGVEALRYVVQQ